MKMLGGLLSRKKGRESKSKGPSACLVFLKKFMKDQYPPMKKYRLIIFDLIDTLAECRGLAEVENKLIAELGQEAVDQFIDSGRIDTIRTPDEAIKKFRSVISLSEAQEKLTREWLEWSRTYLYADTLETLEYLKGRGYKIAILSNSPPTSKDQLADLKIGKYIDQAVFSFQVNARKPEKEIFSAVLEKFGLLPADALMIGDSMKNDIEGARNCGIDGLLLDRSNQSAYEPKITALSDLRHIL